MADQNPYPAGSFFSTAETLVMSRLLGEFKATDRGDRAEVKRRGLGGYFHHSRERWVKCSEQSIEHRCSSVSHIIPHLDVTENPRIATLREQMGSGCLLLSWRKPIRRRRALPDVHYLTRLV
jgi:hypothetical protein